MDMSRYGSSPFLKPEDFEQGPKRKTIVKLEEGKYDKPVATFDNGTRLSINRTNVDALAGAFGWDGEDWINQEIELCAGTLRYNDNDNPAVLVRAINPLPAPAKAKPKPQPAPFDDDIPY
jgi:hypothetical protein